MLRMSLSGPMAATGTPRSSSRVASAARADEHEPQSPTPVMTASQGRGDLFEQLRRHRLAVVDLLVPGSLQRFVFLDETLADARQEAVAVDAVVPQDADALAVERIETRREFRPAGAGL